MALTMAMVTFSACSDDSLTPDDELGNTVFDSNGGTTPLDIAIDSLYNKYGSKAFYTFKASDLFFGWSSVDELWYKAVPSGSESDILKMVRFVKNDAYQGYPDELVSRYLPRRIFLVDSLCTTSYYSSDALVNFKSLSTHAVAISNVSPRLETWTDDDWADLKTSLVSSMLSAIYTTNQAALSDFMDAKDTKWFALYGDMWAPDSDPADPLGQYSTLMYNLYLRGYANASMQFISMEIVAKPNDTADLGYFMTFLFNTPKKDMDNIFSRFSRMKTRAYLLAKFISGTLNIDPVKMQNNGCPTDPVPAGYFDALSD